MTATMKGLLKGLRYISQIFDNSDEDEPEMQIGNPTDVKHVAHIGWDGPSVTSPSWMNDFRSPNESSSAPLNFSQTPNKQDASVPDVLDIPKPRHYSSLDVPSPEPEERRQSRRRHSAGGSINSPGRDLANGLKPKKHQHHHSSLGVDSSDPNNAPSPPSIPKKSRKKKSKESTTEGSSKAGNGASSKSRSKANKAKSKDNDCPISAIKGLSLDDTKDSGGEFPRQDLDL